MIEQLRSILEGVPEPFCFGCPHHRGRRRIGLRCLNDRHQLPTRLGLIVGMPVVLTALSSLRYHACKQQLIDGFAGLERVLHAKWEALSRASREVTARKYLRAFADHAQSVSRDLERAIERVGEVTRYFLETYQPELPAHGALSKQVVETRTDMEEFVNRCPIREGEEAATYLRRPGRSSFLWRRLAAPKTKAPPNAFEWYCVEEFGLQVLRCCNPVLDTNILSLIGSRDDLRRSFETMVKFYAGPFLRLKDAEAENRFGLLESLPAEFGPICQQLEAMCAERLVRVDRIDNGSPYRVALYGFLDSVAPGRVFLGN